MQEANVSKYDIQIASNLGTQLYQVFCPKYIDPIFEDKQHSPPSQGADTILGGEAEDVVFSTFAAGLAFLCGGSPTEDKIMVAFTLVDSDSDGFITAAEFTELITSSLKVVAVCSTIVQNKILQLGSSLRYILILHVNHCLLCLSTLLIST